MISWNWGWSISWNWSRGRGIGWSGDIGWSRCVVSILMVLDETLVRAGHPLVLDIGVVLLVLVHEVVHDLNPAVRELHTVLAWMTGKS